MHRNRTSQKITLTFIQSRPGLSRPSTRPKPGLMAEAKDMVFCPQGSSRTTSLTGPIFHVLRTLYKKISQLGFTDAVKITKSLNYFCLSPITKAQLADPMNHHNRLKSYVLNEATYPHISYEKQWIAKTKCKYLDTDTTNTLRICKCRIIIYQNYIQSRINTPWPYIVIGYIV